MSQCACAALSEHLRVKKKLGVFSLEYYNNWNMNYLKLKDKDKLKEDMSINGEKILVTNI